MRFPSPVSYAALEGRSPADEHHAAFSLSDEPGSLGPLRSGEAGFR
jgi:hypothetical protein